MDIEKALTPDPDVERAFNWFLSFLPAGDWERRKSQIEQYVESLLRPEPTAVQATAFHRLVGTEDRAGWYLYLVETSQHEPYRTEVNQASRVLPVFKRLGADLEKLLSIGGIELQAMKFLNESRGQPDPVLFEMLVALLWSKNGWEDVTFIPPSASEKRADIRAANRAEEWFIEAKRLTTNSEYGQRERDKWLRMWGQFKNCLINNRYPFILDIAIHVELHELDDAFLLSQLKNKLRLISGPCHLISNETWDVHVRIVDFEKIAEHLREQYVKCHSRQLQQLVGGSWDRKKGFTFVMESSNGRIGGERGINQYVEEIYWAAGAYWHCDAERATQAKARSIRGHLADAVRQLPAGRPGVVHVGIETPDGESVEAERYARIVEAVVSFDAKGKDLRWVYTHLYESYAPPETSWLFDETVYIFGTANPEDSEPISNRYTVVPREDGSITGEVHWQRDAP